MNKRKSKIKPKSIFSTRTFIKSNLFTDFSSKEFTIPKKNKKLRTIVEPSEDLKTIQKEALKYLYNMYFLRIKNNFPLSGIQHGFLPKRSVVTLAKKHTSEDKEINSTLFLDIKDFFNSFNESNIDKTILKVFKNHKEIIFYKGTLPQGYKTSPIIANISMLKTLENINHRIKRINKDIVFTIYADDIQVSSSFTSYKEYLPVIEIIEEELSKISLQLNKSKTRIRYSKNNSNRVILGVSVNKTIKLPRKTRRKLRAALHQNCTKSIHGFKSWGTSVEGYYFD